MRVKSVTPSILPYKSISQDYMLQMIKDLGLREYGTQGLKKRWWKVQCPDCFTYFEAAAPNIKNGNTTRCKDCGRKLSNRYKSKKASGTFPSKASKIHNNKYNYTDVQYVNHYTKVKILCPLHGEFFQSPDDHLAGKGCAVCGGRPKLALEPVQKIVEELTNKEYTVSGNYTNKKSKLSFTHVICNHTWKISYDSFVHGGTRCPKCNPYKHSSTHPCILYYFKINSCNQTVWKIGITAESVENRYSKDELSLMSNIQTWWFSTRDAARKAESLILNNYKEYLIKDTNILKTGNTELFYIDIEKDNNFKKELNATNKTTTDSS